MSQQNINVGTVPNDGTGDPIRTAMIKVQNNFSEFYAAKQHFLLQSNKLSGIVLWCSAILNKFFIGE